MVEQKAKVQQQQAAPKSAEKTRMAAPKFATEKNFRHFCIRESTDVSILLN